MLAAFAEVRRVQVSVIASNVYGESSFDLSTITGAEKDFLRAPRKLLGADLAQGTKAFDVSIHFIVRACLVLGYVIININKALFKKVRSSLA